MGLPNSPDLVSLASALHDSHSLEPGTPIRDSSQVRGPLHKRTVPSLRHQKDLKTLNAVLWDHRFQAACSASKLSRHNTNYYAEVPRSQTNGKFNGFPKISHYTAWALVSYFYFFYKSLQCMENIFIWRNDAFTPSTPRGAQITISSKTESVLPNVHPSSRFG